MTSLQNKRIDWLIILERWSDVTLLWKRKGKEQKVQTRSGSHPSGCQSKQYFYPLYSVKFTFTEKLPASNLQQSTLRKVFICL